jgi:hypothetical protein
MTNTTDINIALSELRSTINSDVRLRNEIYQKKDGSWDRLWAAMDALEDAQVAIEEFNKQEDVTYLHLYGLLQAYVVQQDAISHIRETVGGTQITWARDEKKLNANRRLRNETAGHPADIKTPKGIVYCNIDRHSISKEGFNYLLWGKEGADPKKVDLPETIATQEQELIRVIQETIGLIKEHEGNFKAQFGDDKLMDIYKQIDHYQFEKMYLHKSDSIWAQRMFDSVSRVYGKLKDGLEKRYGDFATTINAPGLKLTIQEMDQLLERISLKFEAGIPDDFDFTVYIGSLEHCWKELGEMVQEADDNFS